MKSHVSLTALAVALLLGGSLPAQAQFLGIGQPGNGVILLAQSRLRFRVPRVRSSGSLRSGAARGNCHPEGKAILMVPLLPMTQANGEIQLYPGTTASEHPRFFVHIPETTAQEARFMVVSQTKRQVIYEESFSLPGTSGVVEFRLPDTTTPLAVGESYKWSVELVCDPVDNSGNVAVEGIVQRVETATHWEQVPDRDRPLAYAQADIWYDAVASLAELRQTQPNNPTWKTDWRDLLQSVNLNAIADEPLVSCCQPKNATSQLGVGGN
ncbi:MAG: DUF928 domain-containing protein [Desertifilum sp. SIO1I2]|nr:DUF928 domain-containing protein [Desertifilum sp. SIO1I2]